mmetsp:Transcript_9159/g.22361  ORF Transcript_9159/g.22361 Transcript_9159/m.22361 type:complete len:261 (+) Transcript_9159:178-960(+)
MTGGHARDGGVNCELDGYGRGLGRSEAELAHGVGAAAVHRPVLEQEERVLAADGDVHDPAIRLDLLGYVPIDVVSKAQLAHAVATRGVRVAPLVEQYRVNLARVRDVLHAGERLVPPRGVRETASPPLRYIIRVGCIVHLTYGSELVDAAFHDISIQSEMTPIIVQRLDVSRDERAPVRQDDDGILRPGRGVRNAVSAARGNDRVGGIVYAHRLGISPEEEFRGREVRGRRRPDDGGVVRGKARRGGVRRDDGVVDPSGL